MTLLVLQGWVGEAFSKGNSGYWARISPHSGMAGELWVGICVYMHVYRGRVMGGE